MLDRKKITHRLKTTLFGRNLFLLDEIDSTNKYAMQLARDGAPEGSVVFTAYQTAGRGRLNRGWFSSRGENLLMSIILRPKQNIETIQRITLAVAVVLLEATRSYLKKYAYPQLVLRLKWPNDLLVGDKKLAGILTESILRGNSVEAVIVGIGMNLNFCAEKMPDEIRHTATSIRVETGKRVDVDRFFTYLLYHFEQAYLKLERNGYADVVEQWKTYNHQSGQEIIIRIGEADEYGRFIDVNSAGHLLYRDDKGRMHEIVSAEILSA
ncbi:MAG TPA: biotin--[acetyl-CoA-carboxylase] ligase [Calditrichaeota bacterium]|nr:biotin--[acetyl-CoA-carboxylase] ligase [Calditrichota bacterium]